MPFEPPLDIKDHFRIVHKAIWPCPSAPPSVPLVSEKALYSILTWHEAHIWTRHNGVPPQRPHGCTRRTFRPIKDTFARASKKLEALSVYMAYAYSDGRYCPETTENTVTTALAWIANCFRRGYVTWTHDEVRYSTLDIKRLPQHSRQSPIYRAVVSLLRCLDTLQPADAKLRCLWNAISIQRPHGRIPWHGDPFDDVPLHFFTEKLVRLCLSSSELPDTFPAHVHNDPTPQAFVDWFLPIHFAWTHVIALLDSPRASIQALRNGLVHLKAANLATGTTAGIVGDIQTAHTQRMGADSRVSEEITTHSSSIAALSEILTTVSAALTRLTQPSADDLATHCDAACELMTAACDTARALLTRSPLVTLLDEAAALSRELPGQPLTAAITTATDSATLFLETPSDDGVRTRLVGDIKNGCEAANNHRAHLDAVSHYSDAADVLIRIEELYLKIQHKAQRVRARVDPPTEDLQAQQNASDALNAFGDSEKEARQAKEKVAAMLGLLHHAPLLVNAMRAQHKSLEELCRVLSSAVNRSDELIIAPANAIASHFASCARDINEVFQKRHVRPVTQLDEAITRSAQLADGELTRALIAARGRAQLFVEAYGDDRNQHLCNFKAASNAVSNAVNNHQGLLKTVERRLHDARNSAGVSTATMKLCSDIQDRVGQAADVFAAHRKARKTVENAATVAKHIWRDQQDEMARKTAYVCWRILGFAADGQNPREREFTEAIDAAYGEEFGCECDNILEKFVVRQLHAANVVTEATGRESGAKGEVLKAISGAGCDEHCSLLFKYATSESWKDQKVPVSAISHVYYDGRPDFQETWRFKRHCRLVDEVLTWEERSKIVTRMPEDCRGTCGPFMLTCACLCGRVEGLPAQAVERLRDFTGIIDDCAKFLNGLRQDRRWLGTLLDDFQGLDQRIPVALGKPGSSVMRNIIGQVILTGCRRAFEADRILHSHNVQSPKEEVVSVLERLDVARGRLHPGEGGIWMRFAAAREVDNLARGMSQKTLWSAVAMATAGLSLEDVGNFVSCCAENGRGIAPEAAKRLTKEVLCFLSLQPRKILEKLTHRWRQW